jgi:hypothetical protein
LIKPRPKVPPPTWDETGVFHSTGQETVFIGWQEVEAIYAYKKDCFSVDQIRIILVSDKWRIEFTEDDKDFCGLRMCISSHLKVRPDWHELLARSPAFETTWTVLYPYQSADGSETSE